jgi:hypothetical protein
MPKTADGVPSETLIKSPASVIYDDRSGAEQEATKRCVVTESRCCIKTSYALFSAFRSVKDNQDHQLSWWFALWL